MPTDLDNAQQGTEQQSPSGTSAGQSNVDLSKYVEKERFTGLQGKLQQVLEENTRLKAQLHDVSGSKEEEVATLNNKLTTTSDLKTLLETQLTAVTQERDALKTQIPQFETELAVAKAILDPKYQGLQPLHAKGLLAVQGKVGDDLTKFLDDAVATLQAQTTQGVQQRLNGATPQTPPGGSTPTLQELNEKLFNLRPGTPEYKQTMDAIRATYSKPST